MTRWTDIFDIHKSTQKGNDMKTTQVQFTEKESYADEMMRLIREIHVVATSAGMIKAMRPIRPKKSRKDSRTAKAIAFLSDGTARSTYDIHQAVDPNGTFNKMSSALADLVKQGKLIRVRSGVYQKKGA